MGRTIHEWFSCSRAAYLVIPRLALENMPADWQRKFVALLDEAQEMGLETPEYKVFRKGKAGRIASGSDPWANYRRGNFEEVNGKALRVLS